jgi:hypothetical protein
MDTSDICLECGGSKPDKKLGNNEYYHSECLYKMLYAIMINNTCNVSIAREPVKLYEETE